MLTFIRYSGVRINPSIIFLVTTYITKSQLLSVCLSVAKVTNTKCKQSAF